MSDAREAILERIRSTARGEAGAAPRAYGRESAAPRAEVVERFCARVADYRAETHRVGADTVGAEVAAALDEHGAGRVAVPAGLPSAWRPPSALDSDGLGTAELDGLDGVVTACTVAIAETGTIVLAAGPVEGRRALTLVPDLHVCVVREEQIVGLVPEAIAVLDPLVRTERRPLTFISGPSATSDIELRRVEGVHGPRTLIVLVVGG